MRIPVGFEILRQTLALRHYRLYVLGNITSNLGMWTQRVAMGRLTWELTHSTTWLGINAVAEAGPSIIIGLFAGAVIDRVDQFKLLRLMQTYSLVYSAVLAVLTLTHVIDIWMLTGVVLLRGVVIAFYRPTRMTVIYGLVGREFLPSALALNSMVFNTSRFLGPAIGGTIIATAGTGWSFVFAFFLFTFMTARVCARSSAPAAPCRRSRITPPLDHSRDHRRLPLHHPSRRHPHAALPADRDVGRRQADHGSAAGLRRRGLRSRLDRPRLAALLPRRRRDDRRHLADLARQPQRPDAF